MYIQKCEILCQVECEINDSKFVTYAAVSLADSSRLAFKFNTYTGLSMGAQLS